MQRLRTVDLPSQSELMNSLSGAGWLSSQPSAFVEEIVRISTFIKCDPGETICWEGDLTDSIYGVVCGGVGIYVSSDRSTSALATIIRSGTWFGLGPLLLGGERNLGFRSIDPSIVAVVRASDIMAIAAQDGLMGFRVASVAEFAVNVAAEIVSDLLIPKADKRIAATLLRVTKNARPCDEPAGNGYMLTQSELGEMANASRNYVNRTLKILAELGAIEKCYHHIRILDRNALASFVASDI